MSSESQNTVENSDFLSFNTNRTNDDGKNNRNNFQYRPYNRNRNQRNPNFRHNQYMGGPNEGDPQFSPANFSSPVSGYQHRGFRPHHMNQFPNQRNFTPYKKFGGNHHRGGGGGGHGSPRDIPIQQYFHKTMLEDPWADCHKFNGTANETNCQTEPVPTELTVET
ncbi:putative uncharacterized protein DDB_G0282133 [Contarinia nasturtii]|uniref:putative uncharacterized protein DDB_G0282133 n=1 Tax=Contarinia nasturtii TaxID=265458 RepID=UPI0012D463EB|nr:putative uncharacterized protein DDB_G0282133 [Contarinia nasturtii]